MGSSVIIPTGPGYTTDPAPVVVPSGGSDCLADSLDDSPGLSFSVPCHPLGIKPSGNQYTAASNAKSVTGPFQLFPDEISAIFLEYLDAQQLRLLGSTCKFLYAFCRSDDIWKALFIESNQSKSGSFVWRGTWRSTFLGLSSEHVSHIRCDNVFSDVLFRPFLCTHTSLAPYCSNVPRENAIARLKDLSPIEFSEKWSDKPFILTEQVRKWPVFRSWDTESLIEQYGDVKFRAEAVDWTFNTYAHYMRNSSDESPLYLFDRSFVEKMNLKVGQNEESPSYWIPECFGDDLFAVLGDQRPDDKWLIVGPARSGSTYHKDPNATSAWNAVLRGSKYWIMFPSKASSPPPPGVYVSEDQSEVTSPLSIAEWLLGFHAEARRTPGCVEGVCGEGEVLHVPSGWWHLVVNLEPSIAITQNFVPRSHLSDVLSFLRDKPDQVSGFVKGVTDPYGLFVDRMRNQHPELLEQAVDELKRRADGKKRTWDLAIGNEGEAAGAGFSFGFGGDSDEEVP
ncbi:Clavaminate synthase-like protein [Venustampulla echinocandica]|uniref:Clavaminate synthase-like protein n=1 Tax=Venustampulla echinocandica TaxID=2656787 RepID=A0A370TMS8_9HELO|nr:Clavaminate synthase-like protein [Venustampulla echinocandica]RDL36843.1 Clavaminate synthase-like protein [Venustampulla echinocandica]